ncbi:hypothetical protein GBAR_LOCUS10570 [Geodia barretti]|uniref:Uncharacterized protein n=1 Tax=Geodia barretti TaxID=519541 RepID=A0AA35RUB3_GEOBA|nr:hypothetical protein GBAR_LOCUS10570 [Geodia barretti]
MLSQPPLFSIFKLKVKFSSLTGSITVREPKSSPIMLPYAALPHNAKAANYFNGICILNLVPFSHFLLPCTSRL